MNGCSWENFGKLRHRQFGAEGENHVLIRLLKHTAVDRYLQSFASRLLVYLG